MLFVNISVNAAVMSRCSSESQLGLQEDKQLSSHNHLVMTEKSATLQCAMTGACKAISNLLTTDMPNALFLRIYRMSAQHTHTTPLFRISDFPA